MSFFVVSQHNFRFNYRLVYSLKSFYWSYFSYLWAGIKFALERALYFVSLRNYALICRINPPLLDSVYTNDVALFKTDVYILESTVKLFSLVFERLNKTFFRFLVLNRFEVRF